MVEQPLVAYAYLQYVDLPEMERKEIINDLYRYYELNTLAMVMIYEGLKEIIMDLQQKNGQPVKLHFLDSFSVHTLRW